MTHFSFDEVEIDTGTDALYSTHPIDYLLGFMAFLVSVMHMQCSHNHSLFVSFESNAMQCHAVSLRTFGENRGIIWVM